MGQRWYILVQDTTPSNDYERQEQTVLTNFFISANLLVLVGTGPS
jgi:hypothetical protein